MSRLAPGDLLDGKYRISRLLGCGGMGAVYAAERVTLGDLVAVKCILGEQNTEENRARFVREARAAARIRHPNVVQVFDFGIPERGAPYMVMEYLDGPTLADVLAADPQLGIDRALEVFAAVCSAVEAGHRRGVVHRDIKPGNVILAYGDDGRETTKVLDFGLARLVTEVVDDDLSRPGALLGTVAYMAPEQVAEGRVTPASDVFALAVLLYEMVTAKLPFSGANQLATLLRISQGDYDPIDRHRDGLPRAIVEAIADGLSVDPSRRPHSPEELARAAGAPIETPRPRAKVREAPTPSPSRAVTHLGQQDTRRPGEVTHSSGPRLTLERGGPRATPDDATFHGRVDELAELEAEYQRSLESAEARPVLVTGAAGVGKTALLDELVRRIRRRAAHVVRGRFFAYEGDRPPPLEALHWMRAGAGSGSGPQMKPGAPSEDREDKWRAFARLAQAFVADAGDQPLVLAIDDLQWASELDLEFLAYLPHGARPHPVAIFGTARREASDELARWEGALARQLALRRIELPELTEEGLRAWLSAMFGRIRIRPRDVRRIHHATGGNAFAVTETIRRLVTSGKIARQDDAWVCDDLYDVGLPHRVQAHVEARLSGVSRQLREVLDLACVIGEQLRFETLVAASGLDEPTLEGRVDEAVELGLLSERDVSPGADVRFALPGLRKVLYDSLTPRARRRFHRRAVDALGRLYASDFDRIARVLAYHYHAIEDWPATLEHALVAATATLEGHDNDDAQTCLQYARRAMEELARAKTPPPPEVLAKLQYLEGALHVRLGRVDAASVELERAAEAASSVQAPSLQLDVLLALADCHLGRGAFAEGVEVGMRAIGSAQALGDRRREFEARVQVARCAGPLGRLDDAESTLTPVLEATEDEHRATRAFALRELAWIRAKRGRFEEAEQAALEATSEARRAQDALAEYRAASVLGLVKAECGDYRVAIEQLQRALALARALSLRRREGIELGNLGESHHLAGDTATGLELARQGLAIFREIGDLASEGDCRVNVGRMLGALGRTDEAIEMLEAGRDACARSGRLEYEAIAMCELGKLLATRGESVAARSSFELARSRLDAIASPLVWEAELGLAQVCLTLGLHSRAVAHAEEAKRRVEVQLSALPRGRASPGLRRAHVLVSRLLEDDVTRTQS